MMLAPPMKKSRVTLAARQAQAGDPEAIVRMFAVTNMNLDVWVQTIPEDQFKDFAKDVVKTRHLNRMAPLIVEQIAEYKALSSYLTLMQSRTDAAQAHLNEVVLDALGQFTTMEEFRAIVKVRARALHMDVSG